MTTKNKIIAGFLFMIALLIGVASFAYLRMSDASTSFASYSAEARTAVNANWADALMREGKDKLSNFVITLDPKFAEQAYGDWANSVKLVESARKDDANTANQAKLTEQVGQMKKMEESAREMQTKLLLADEAVLKKIVPLGNTINERLTNILQAAIAANGTVMLNLVDDAYTAYSDLNTAVRLYNSAYLPADGENAYTLLGNLSTVLKKMDSAAGTDAGMRSAYIALNKPCEDYGLQFKVVDTAIKEAIRARKQLMSTSATISDFFDIYTEAAQQHMNELGTATRANNANAQSLMAIGGGIGVALGLAFALWIIIGVVKALSQVSRFAGEVARGNFNAQLNVREGGEIGAMVSALMQIPSTLNAVTGEFHDLEQRVVAGYLEVQGDVSKFSGGFATLVQGTNNILKRMGIILNNIPSPMVMLNKDLKASYLNKIAQDLAGTDYMGKTCEEMFCREDYGSSTCGLMSAVKTSGVSTGETVAHPRGRRMDVRYTAIPMQDNNGKLASVLQFIVDLTQIKDTERKIKAVAEEALENTERVAAASEELSAQVEQVSRGADIQRSRVESTATAMNEMNATVLEVARSAGNASEQTEDTRTKANDGATLVNKVVASINGVNTVALGLQDNMKELGQQAESIGGVMNVISDIADQTNLLALNAAIEAARAGEAGRGFAVVADEVRKLAEKTMSATQEVGSNIQAIQHSARANISEVTNAVRNISEATDLANASGQALNEIVRLASSNSAVVTSIATAAEQQSATSEEINHSLEDVSRIVMETADGMSQASAAVQDLSQTAQQLKRVMEQLRA